MLLISWNVAALSTTLQRIHRDYSSFSTFLERHGNPDIVCIQEHKIPLSKLSTRSEPFQITSTGLPNYESFWSCCTDKSKKGFNGVVTFVKKGMTTNATSTPFHNPILDNQGRCIMTDHQSFVIFNVYAPATGGGPDAVSNKMKFLKGLQKCVEREQSLGKKVFVVGDLNICHDSMDKHWRYRSIHVDSVIQEVLEWKNVNGCDDGDDDEKQKPQQWKIDVANHWSTIQKTLSTIEATPFTTKNVATGKPFDKYRAKVTLLHDGRKISIGKAESTKEECLSYFHFPQYTYYDEDLQKDVVYREANMVHVDTLYELMSKIVNVEWSSSMLSCISNSCTNKSNNVITGNDLEKKVEATTQNQWLNALLHDNDMVDPFRLLYPLAKDR